jgi:hypothetical protein
MERLDSQVKEVTGVQRRGGSPVVSLKPLAFAGTADIIRFSSAFPS